MKDVMRASQLPKMITNISLDGPCLQGGGSSTVRTPWEGFRFPDERERRDERENG